MLVCIYTCEKHRDLLTQFHESILGEYLRGLAGARILEVYANPDIPHSAHENYELVLKTPERYGALSLKTHKMIDYCVRHFDFQHLLKIDVATVRTDLSEPEFAGRKPVDLDKLVQFLKSASFNTDYDGFTFFENVPRQNSENWAMKKGKSIEWQKVFGDRTQLPPFYRGLCYIMSKRFARYISQNGREMAEEHEKYFLGSEDVMIGRLHGEFLAGLGTDFQG